MATIRDVLNAFIIFSKYEDPDLSVSTEHDVIYAGSETTKENASPADLKDLKKAGWHWDEEFDCYRRFT